MSMFQPIYAKRYHRGVDLHIGVMTLRSESMCLEEINMSYPQDRTIPWRSALLIDRHSSTMHAFPKSWKSLSYNRSFSETEIEISIRANDPQLFFCYCPGFLRPTRGVPSHMWLCRFYCSFGLPISPLVGGLRPRHRVGVAPAPAE